MKNVLYDTYDFAKIIRGDNVYVDKTAMLHRLVAGREGSRFFIARPRRFGKSLMISTLEYIFKAWRELFDGLEISKTDYAWPAVPVVHLDMSSVVSDDIEGRSLYCSARRAPNNACGISGSVSGTLPMSCNKPALRAIFGFKPNSEAMVALRFATSLAS